MKKYVIKRILSVIPVLFIVSIVVFSLTHLTPGSPASMILGEDATQAEVEALEEEMGLHDPFLSTVFQMAWRRFTWRSRNFCNGK